MIQAFFSRIFDKSFAENQRNIVRLLERLPEGGTLCDLGCDDGVWTTAITKAARSAEVLGYEVVESRAAEAERRGIKVAVGDLNARLLLADNTFDIVHANQVIEHLYDTDHFVREIHRILKVDGIAIVSTENLASWHNIGALLFGWQPFSSTNISAQSIGNPLSAWRGRGEHPLTSWQHQRLFSYRGLKELFINNGFRVERIVGAGYYPFPSSWGRMEPRHAHFITIAARKQ